MRIALVEPAEAASGTHVVAESADESAALDNEMKRRAQREAVGAEKGGGSWSALAGDPYPHATVRARRERCVVVLTRSTHNANVGLGDQLVRGPRE
jgi:hypothetical protein